MASTDRREPRELVGEVERLLEEAEGLPDPVTRQTAIELVQALLELYGAGLERIVAEVNRSDGGLTVLAEDELVSHLLLLHGLHPAPLEQRVAAALEEVRPYLESHGGNVELLAIDGASARLRLQGSCSGCPSSAMTLKLAIENAIHKTAPEIEEVIAEEETTAATPLLQIEVAPGLGQAPAGAPPVDGEWKMVGGLPELAGGRTVVKGVGGQAVLFLKLGGRFYGYRPQCPACQDSLAGADLEGTELSCPGCGNRYDAMRAGRCLDSPQLHLEPLPLLEGDDGLVKVALPVPV